MKQKVTTLDQLQKREKFEVIHLAGNGEIKKRLLDMGFIPGAQGMSLRRGIFKDPIEIQLGAYKISVRRAEARNIHVLFLGSQGPGERTAIDISLGYRKKGDLLEIAKQLAGDTESKKISKTSEKKGGFKKYFSYKKIHDKEYQQMMADDITGSENYAADNVIRIAIAGNPNTGKSSLFNAMTGSRVKVGNYPGVTVDTKKVRINYKDYVFEFIDLPGTYSLTAYSFEEVISRDFILFQKPDVVLDVLDSTNLERNLYLCLQLQELGVPIVGALNMIDESENLGIQIDSDHLSNLLQVPFVKTSAIQKRGIDILLEELLTVTLKHRGIQKKSQKSDMPYGLSEPVGRHLNYGKYLEEVHNQLILDLSVDAEFAREYSLHWVAIKLIEKDEDAIKKVASEHWNGQKVLENGAIIRKKIQNEFGIDATSMVAGQRYGFIKGAVKEALTMPEKETKQTLTEMLDKFALNRFGGIFIFFGIMYLIYSITFNLGNILSDYIDSFFGFIGSGLTTVLPQGLLQDFVVQGVIGGVGGVLVFLPIILLIFAGLSFLEDSGYLARAAFVMDKFMHQFGMHGRSFIPLMISTGCAVPAVMSTRALASQKDRVITAIVLPMMMCTAKTPVIAMLVGAFFTAQAGLVFWLIWVLAWFIALLSSLILSKTVFHGDATPFVMELPPYRFPTLVGTMKHMWMKTVGYLKKAGTIILAASIVTWIVFNFPRKDTFSFDYQAQKKKIMIQLALLRTKKERLGEVDLNKIKSLRKEINSLENKKSKEEIEYSLGGRFGKFIEPLFSVMGFDWKMSISLVAALPAKEIVISTMGVVYGIGEVDVESGEGRGGSLKEAMRRDKKYNKLIVISFMIFVLIYTPCFATLAVIRREMGSWRWVFFSVFFSMGIAALLATGVYQIGRLLI